MENIIDEKSKKKPIPGRLYNHYKGGIYEVLHLAKHSETDEDLVIYQSIHYGSYHARPLSMWFEEVKPGVKRFELEIMYSHINATIHKQFIIPVGTEIKPTIRQKLINLLKRNK